MSQHLLVIACGSAKRSEPARASDLYTGGLFQDAIGYARANTGEFKKYDMVRILSAKYGFLTFDQIVAPYDVWLGNVKGVRRIRLEGALMKQIKALVGKFGNIGEITVLGGAPYVALIQSVVRSYVVIHAPLKGMTQGARRHWFKQEREAATRPPALDGPLSSGPL